MISLRFACWIFILKYNLIKTFLNIILIWPWMGGTHPGISWCHPWAPSCKCWQPTRQGRTRAQGQSRYRHGRLDQDVKTLTTMLILSFVNYSCTWSSLFWFRLFLSNFQRLGDWIYRKELIGLVVNPSLHGNHNLQFSVEYWSWNILGEKFSSFLHISWI